MGRGLWMSVVVGIILVTGIIIVIQSSTQNLLNRCCQECLTAFSQSPVGVGPQGARCGTFTTGSPLSAECQDYFSSSPRTVAECEK